MSLYIVREYQTYMCIHCLLIKVQHDKIWFQQNQFCVVNFNTKVNWIIKFIYTSMSE